jgi:hypothetical protein
MAWSMVAIILVNIFCCSVFGFSSSVRISILDYFLRSSSAILKSEHQEFTFLHTCSGGCANDKLITHLFWIIGGIFCFWQWVLAANSQKLSSVLCHFIGVAGILWQKIGSLLFLSKNSLPCYFWPKLGSQLSILLVTDVHFSFDVIDIWPSTPYLFLTHQDGSTVEVTGSPTEKAILSWGVEVRFFKC